jgi:hypothetical protein
VDEAVLRAVLEFDLDDFEKASLLPCHSTFWTLHLYAFAFQSRRFPLIP